MKNKIIGNDWLGFKYIKIGKLHHYMFLFLHLVFTIQVGVFIEPKLGFILYTPLFSINFSVSSH